MSTAETSNTITSRSPSPPEITQTMSLVVQLGTAVCSNNIVTNQQQSSPLAATAIASSNRTVSQFPTSPDLSASSADVNNATTTTPLLSQQTSLVVTSQFQTVYKKASNSAHTNNTLLPTKLSTVNSNGQRVQTVNVQRPMQLSHIAPQSKVQVLSNVVVPKNSAYVVSKPAVNRQHTTQTSSVQLGVGTKQIVTNTPQVSSTRTNASLNIINPSKTQINNKQLILNNTSAVQLQQPGTKSSQNYITATTVQPINTQQVGPNANAVQGAARTIVNATKFPSQTHVISRVITPITKSPTQQPLKINTSPMVVQQRSHSTGIKTLPAQLSPTGHSQKVPNNSSRIQNNVVQQRSGGIKTIPPQRSNNNYTKGSNVQKINSTIKSNNFIVKNSVTSPRIQQNLLSPKAKNHIVVHANQTTSTRMNVMTANPSIVKYQGQQFQVINSNQSTQSLVSTQSSPVTVVRTVASYEDNNVPSSIANTLFSPTHSQSDNLDVSQDNYLSEEDVISEVRPDYTNCTNPVLFDHNYHLPPPDSPPSSPTKSTFSESSTNVIHTNGNLTNTNQVSPNYIYGNKVSGRLNITYNSETNQIPEDDVVSTISSDGAREVEPEGEETETAPEGEGEEDSVTRCICDFEHDDGYMICCDKCFVWQHVDCMFIDRQNIQEEYLCERCEPRRVDRQRARAIQLRKREEILNNGSSSDTSSASSMVDNANINNNISNKKRPIVSQPTNSVGRRKNESGTQRNRSLSNSQRRSRRDLHQSVSTVRKNSLVKRRQERKVQTKRKTKTRRNQENNEDSQDAWDRTRGDSNSSVLQLRQWIENYEEAVTNHYSPELRARIMKQNGQNLDTKLNNLHSLVQANTNVHKCRTVPQPNIGTKILVSTMYLAPNTPIIELRGKYMLGSPQPPGSGTTGTTSGRHHAQRPGPFLFFYKLPKDGVEVCVDTRTYGNDARFVRRSCKPNTEVRHCIEKGTLHLYLVSLVAIEKNTELTIKHEAFSLVGSNPVIPCACGNPLQCGVVTNVNTSKINTPTNNVITSSSPSSSTTMVTRRSNGVVHDLVELNTQRKRRGRRTTSTSEPELISPKETITKAPTPVPVTSVSPPPVEIQSTPVVTAIIPPVSTSSSTAPPKEGPSRRSSQNTRVVSSKNEDKIESTPVTSSNTTEKIEEKEAKDKRKMTREERKMEAIMKAFERLEKQEQRKQESKTRQAHRRESDPPPPDVQNIIENQKTKRKKRKGRSRTISTNSYSGINIPGGRRRNRVNSTDSYMTSGDDSSLTSPPLPAGDNDSNNVNNSQPVNVVEVNNSAPEEEEMLNIEVQRTNEESLQQEILEQDQHMSTEGHAAGLLLALANGGQHNEDHLKSPTRDPDTCSSTGSVQSSPGTPLSSNCLLVAAAVEQITPGFKFPKTKKAIMNEWLNKSPEPVQPASSISPMSLQPQVPQISRPIELPSPLSISTPTDNTSPCRQSLATLVQAANICSASPNVHPTGGNAKKRWLRQAISEECDSPNSRPESPHASEMIAPPKKRRLARESLSSEQSFTPPTTPTRPNNSNEDFDGDNILNNEEEYYSEDKISNDFPDDINQKSLMEENSQLEELSKEKYSSIVQENGHLSQDVEIEKEESSVLENFDSNISIAKTQVEDIKSVVNSTVSLDPRLRYESPQQCLGKVEETLQLLESWTYRPKSEPIPPAKRKLSISEYRQRKQKVVSITNTNQNNEKTFTETSVSPVDTSNSNIMVESPRPVARARTNSSSSATSSLSSDDEQKEINLLSVDTEKEKGVGVAVAFNSAPTLVERQRENLTARLKREFGLFVPEDDESKKSLGTTGESTILGQRLSLRTSSFLSATEETPRHGIIISTGSVTSTSSTIETSTTTNSKVDVHYSTNSGDAPASGKFPPTTMSIPHQLPNGTTYKAVVPPVNFITPFDNPVYSSSTTYYTGFPTGKSYLIETTSAPDKTSSSYSFLKTSGRK